MVREVRAVLALGPERSWRVPVVKTEATRGEGIAKLRETIDAHRAHIEEEGTLAERRARNLRAEVIGIAAWRLRARPRGARRRRTPNGPACSTASSGAKRTPRPPPASCWTDGLERLRVSG